MTIAAARSFERGTGGNDVGASREEEVRRGEARRTSRLGTAPPRIPISTVPPRATLHTHSCARRRPPARRRRRRRQPPGSSRHSSGVRQASCRSPLRGILPDRFRCSLYPCSAGFPRFTSANASYGGPRYEARELPRLLYLSLDSGSAHPDPQQQTPEAVREGNVRYGCGGAPEAPALVPHPSNGIRVASPGRRSLLSPRTRVRHAGDGFGQLLR